MRLLDPIKVKEEVTDLACVADSGRALSQLGGPLTSLQGDDP